MVEQRWVVATPFSQQPQVSFILLTPVLPFFFSPINETLCLVLWLNVSRALHSEYEPPSLSTRLTLHYLE